MNVVWIVKINELSISKLTMAKQSAIQKNNNRQKLSISKGVVVVDIQPKSSAEDRM